MQNGDDDDDDRGVGVDVDSVVPTIWTKSSNHHHLNCGITVISLFQFNMEDDIYATTNVLWDWCLSFVLFHFGVVGVT